MTKNGHAYHGPTYEIPTLDSRKERAAKRNIRGTQSTDAVYSVYRPVISRLA
jgi:hypothetical protein